MVNRQIEDERAQDRTARHLAAIVESSEDAIVSLDLTGTILTWNRAAERMYGFSEPEAVGRPISILISPELRDEQMQIIDRLKNGEHIAHYDTVRITKAGTPIEVSLTLSPLRDSTGTIVGISGIVRDIAERKRSERALRGQLQFETFLFELSRTFIGLPEAEVDAYMAQGLARVGAFLELDRVTLLELSRDRTAMNVAYTWSAPGTSAASAILSQAAVPWWVSQVLDGQVSLASRVDDLPEEAAAEKEFLRHQGVASAASIPLRVSGDIAGAISFLTMRRHVIWTEELVNRLRAIGDILWNAMKRRQAMQAVLAAQEGVRESEERFRLAMNTVAAGLYTVDLDGLVTYVNPAAEAMFGLTQAELLGRKMHDVTHYLHPDGTPYPASECPGLQVLQQGIELREHEDVFIRRDGRFFPVVYSASPLRKDGATVGIVVGFRDDTERRESERALREREALQASEDRYRGLAEQIVEGIIVTDAQGRLLDANQAACEMVRYTLEELKALTTEDLLVAEQVPELADGFQRIDTADVVRTQQHLRRKDGSVFVGEVTGRRLPDGRLQVVVRDITEHERDEELQRRLHGLAMLSIQRGTLADVLRGIVETAIAVARADFGNIQLLDPTSSHLRIVAHRGFPQWWIEYWQMVAEGRGSCGTALARGEHVVVEDVEQSEIFSGIDLDMQRNAGVRAVQSVPLVARTGRVVGMLSTHYKAPCRPDERTVQRLLRLAHETADIIGYAQAEADLSRQAALLDLAHSSIFVRDHDGRITYWNESAARCYGWSKDEALGKNSHALLQTQFSEPLDRIVDTMMNVGHWEGELVHTCRDGRRITVDSRWAIQQGANGQDFWILEINNDITARKQAEAALRESEQQLQSYIDQAGDAIYVLDGQSGRILNANTRATQMTGYTRGELLALSAADIETTLAPAAIDDLHQHTRGGVVAVEGRHRRKDGSTFPVEISMTSSVPASPHRILAIVRDVSDRKRLEEERADEARRKDEFMAFLGHELRNPLAAVDMAIRALSTDQPQDQRNRMQEIISRQTVMMRRLVNDLLDHERITHGHMELKRVRVDLAECLSRAAAAVRSVVESRQQELVLRLPSRSVDFMVDYVRLDQILGNLLTNASKYTKPGGTIELSGERAGEFVVIHCKDNGQGIPVEYQQKIFEPFERGRKTALGYGEASVGLGLALVKHLTQLHGGTISVDSAGDGLGSQFTLRLPFLAPPSAAAVAEVPSDHVAAHPRSIVIVEDNPSVGTTLRVALQQTGHSVVLFADGPSALAGVAGLKPDALLIDIGLPGMDGYDLAARLRQHTGTRDALYIAVSGFKRRTPDGVRDEFDHYLTKPVELPALLSLLDTR
jgi:PAS domain S-box-containing protein